MWSLANFYRQYADRPWIYNLCDAATSKTGQFDPADTRGGSRVDPQLLWQCYDEIHDQ